MENTKKFYRATFRIIGHLDQFGEYIKPIFPDIQICFSTYHLVRETEKGHWISLSGFDYGKIWVSKTSKKRYAYPTKKEAIVGFIKRQERCIEIMSSRIKNASIAISKASELITL